MHVYELDAIAVHSIAFADEKYGGKDVEKRIRICTVLIIYLILHEEAI